MTERGTEMRAEDRSDARGWEEALDDPEQPLYTVGVVADLMGVDAQVVRGYDQRGLVVPDRSGAGHRRYSRADVRRLSRAIELADEGIATAGIERILALEDELDEQSRDDDHAPASDDAAAGQPED